MGNRINKTYCIIGSGPSGLAMAKNLKIAGIPFDVYESSSDIGGLWNYNNPLSALYKSTHLISSKKMTEYKNFPMPDSYPDYPSHILAYEYLKSYAQHYQLYSHIKLNTKVEKVIKSDDLWIVITDKEIEKKYQGVILASGYNWDPRYPDYKGDFDGEIIHSFYYNEPQIFKNKRVLIVGAGNSGCDIAVEACLTADKTYHSMRRAYHYIPKYIFGQPADVFGETTVKLGAPLFIRQLISKLILKLYQGDPQQYGLPKPDHNIFETHPIINSKIFYHLGHGDIIPKPDIRELRGKKVLFSDNSEVEIDIIIYSTGYKVSFPYLDPSVIQLKDGYPEFFLHIFHPNEENLFAMGLVQPDSGVWWMLDTQAQLILQVIKTKELSPEKYNKFINAKKNTQYDLGKGLRYIKSPRHVYEVDHHSYNKLLNKWIKTLKIQ